METLARQLKTFGDPTRLRILRLLSHESLNVGELTGVLGIAQPSVSKQLGELKRAGLVSEARHNGYVFYRLEGEGGPIWQAVAHELQDGEDQGGDLARLADAVRRRHERGGGSGRLLEPGRSWPAWARALGWLIPRQRVVDLGCGDGALTAEIARWARQVVAVDHDGELLGRARERIRREKIRHVQFKKENLEALSLADDTFDLAILSQALHYFPDPAGPLAEAHRILASGGRLLLLDLAPHGEEWVKEKLGHQHLGFRVSELSRKVRKAGFREIRSDEMPKGPGQPFRILILTGVKP